MMLKSKLERVSQWLARICLFLSASCLVAIMLVTVIEVIGRYGFNAPIFGRQDIAQILLACSIFFAFPVVTLRGEQIDVDLLDGFFSNEAAFWRDWLIGILTSATLLTMAYWLFHRADKTLSRGITSELLFLPKYPLFYFIAFVFLASGILMGLLCLMKLIARLNSKEAR